MVVYLPYLSLDGLTHDPQLVDASREVGDPEVNDCTQLSQIVAFAEVL